MQKENDCHTPTSSSVHEQQRRAQAIKTLKDSMLRLSMSQNPSLTKSQQALLSKKIDLHLPSLLPTNLQTPNHPPYAEMISTAIHELRKRKGSTKASISAFIKSRYDNLPLAHEEYLSHHIEKLVSVGEIVAVTKSLYTLPCGEGDILNVPPLNASLPNEGWQNKEVDSNVIVPSRNKGQENEEVDANEIVSSTAIVLAHENDGIVALQDSPPANVHPLNASMCLPNEWWQNKEVDSNVLVPSPNKGQENKEVDDNEIEGQEKKEVDADEIVSSTAIVLAHENDGIVAVQDSPPAIEAVKPLLKVFTRRAKVVDTTLANTSDIGSSNVVVLAIENGDNVAEQDPGPMIEVVKPLLKTFSRRGREKPTDKILKEEREVDVEVKVKEIDVVMEETKPLRKMFSRQGREKPADKILKKEREADVEVKETKPLRKTFSRQGRGKPAEKYTL
ncbi:hypothetical protein ACHQM5_029231 [Ranunculus cassubicifolius]